MHALSVVWFLACAGQAAALPQPAQASAMKKALLNKKAKPDAPAPVEEVDKEQGNDALFDLLRNSGGMGSTDARHQKVEQPSMASMAQQRKRAQDEDKAYEAMLEEQMRKAKHVKKDEDKAYEEMLEAQMRQAGQAKQAKQAKQVKQDEDKAYEAMLQAQMRQAEQAKQAQHAKKVNEDKAYEAMLQKQMRQAEQAKQAQHAKKVNEDKAYEAMLQKQMRQAEQAKQAQHAKKVNEDKAYEAMLQAQMRQAEQAKQAKPVNSEQPRMARMAQQRNRVQDEDKAYEEMLQAQMRQAGQAKQAQQAKKAQQDEDKAYEAMLQAQMRQAEQAKQAQHAKKANQDEDKAYEAMLQAQMRQAEQAKHAKQQVKQTASQGGGDLPGLLKNLGGGGKAGATGGKDSMADIMQAVNHPEMKKMMSDPKFQEQMKQMMGGGDMSSLLKNFGGLGGAGERQSPKQAAEGDDLPSLLKSVGAGSGAGANQLKLNRNKPATRDPIEEALEEATSGYQLKNQKKTGARQPAPHHDPLEEMLQHVSRPENKAEIKKMLNDPKLHAQAEKMMAHLEEHGGASGSTQKNTADQKDGTGLLDLLQGLGGGSSTAKQNTVGRKRDTNPLPTHTPRDWELHHLDRHRKGEINEAELGMAHLKEAMNDPSVMQEWMQALHHPENHKALKKMIGDPSFQEKAQQALGQMEESGDLPEFYKKLQQAQGGRQHHARSHERRHVPEQHRTGRTGDQSQGLDVANIAKLKRAMKDPSVMSELSQMMNDPETMAELRGMMDDPSFRSQAEELAEQMKTMEL